MILYHSNNAVSTAKVIYCCVGQQVTLNDAERKNGPKRLSPMSNLVMIPNAFKAI